jgi:CubicO group peptidase (beta-lactamase class C family)
MRFVGMSVICAILCLPASAFGQAVVAKDRPPNETSRVAPAAVDDLSPLLSASVEKFKLPGMAAVIVEGNRVTAIGAAGIRCRGQADRITVDDQFHIGSDTKSMTATVVAMLIEEGKLRWTSTPAEILPKDKVTTIDPAWKRVTLEELLTHRGGVRANPDPVGLLFLRAFAESPQQERRDVCRMVLRKPPDKAPGKGFRYSNTGFIIAGTMAETVAGKPWEDLMRERLFGPLGMASAGYGPPGMPPAMPPEAPPSKKSAKSVGSQSPLPPSAAVQPCGHLESGLAIPPSWAADNPACFGPAGTVHVSLRDWAKYAAFHLAGERGTPLVLPGASKPLLSVESLRRLHTPLGGPMNQSGARYAMGWGVGKDPKTDETVLMHFGSNTFWLAGIALYPARNVAILVATNQGGAEAQQACSQLLRTLAARKPHR